MDPPHPKPEFAEYYYYYYVTSISSLESYSTSKCDPGCQWVRNTVLVAQLASRFPAVPARFRFALAVCSC